MIVERSHNVQFCVIKFQRSQRVQLWTTQAWLWRDRSRRNRGQRLQQVPNRTQGAEGAVHVGCQHVQVRLADQKGAQLEYESAKPLFEKVSLSTSRFPMIIWCCRHGKSTKPCGKEALDVKTLKTFFETRWSDHDKKSGVADVWKLFVSYFVQLLRFEFSAIHHRV